jgi:hypothetical protein
MTLSKDFKLEARAIHQILSGVVILPSDVASDSNLQYVFTFF